MTTVKAFPKPVPLIDAVSRPYWEAVARGELLAQRCQSCRQFSYPPALACSKCQSGDLAYEEVAGGGTLYASAVMRQALHAGFVDEIPFVLCMVQLDEAPELAMIATLRDVAIEDVRIGMRVQVDFEERESVTVPVFRAA